jgi:hypothetical protein
LKRILAFLLAAAAFLPGYARADEAVVSLAPATSLIGASTYLQVSGVGNNQLLFNTTLFGVSAGFLTINPNSITSSYLSTLLAGPGSCTNCNLSYDASGRLTVATSGSGGGGGGNFTGPAGAVSGDLISFNGTSGLIGQDSGILQSNVVTASGALTTNSILLGGGSRALGASIGPSAQGLAGWNTGGTPSVIALGSNLSMTGATLNAAGGGGGTPGGATQSIQINSSGAFAGIGPTAQTLAGWNTGGAAATIALGSNLSMTGSTLNATGGGSTAFSALTSGTNTTAAMLVGSGSSLGVTGTGAVTATNVPAALGTGSVCSTAGVLSAPVSCPISLVPQAGTSFALVAGNAGSLVVAQSGSIPTVTLAQSTGALGAGFGVDLFTGAPGATLNITTSRINGGISSLKLGAWQDVAIGADGTGQYLGALSVPQPPTQTGSTFLRDDMTWQAAGSGVTWPATHDVVVSNSTNTPAGAAPSTSGFVLTSNGGAADPTFQALPGATTAVFFAGPASGTANVITVPTTTPGGYTLTDQFHVSFKAAATNTSSAPTLNVNGTGAVVMAVQAGGGLVSLPSNYIVTSQQYDATYQASCPAPISANCYVVTTTPGSGGVIATTNQTPSAAAWGTWETIDLNATGLTVTVPVSTTLSPTGGLFIGAVSGTATLIATSPDTIKTTAGTTGAGGSITLSAGTVTKVTTDGAGHIYAAGNAVSSGSLAIGTTPITGGSGLPLSDAGGVLMEKPITGTGNVVLSGAPTITSPTLTGAASSTGTFKYTQAAPPPCPLIDASTIAVSAACGGVQTVTVAGSRTLGFPTGLIAATNQIMTFQVTASGTGLVLTMGSGYSPSSMPLNPINGSVTTFSCAVDQASSTAQCNGGAKGFLTGYTIGAGASQIPACSASTEGILAYVTDAASTPVYNATQSGGGAVVVPVFCNGTNWTNH